MKGEHLLAFGLGLLVGWLVLPMVIGMVSGGTKAA
jgi:hypothetical protein